MALVLDFLEGFEEGWGVEVLLVELAHGCVCNKINLGGLYYL